MFADFKARALFTFNISAFRKIFPLVGLLKELTELINDNIDIKSELLKYEKFRKNKFEQFCG